MVHATTRLRVSRQCFLRPRHPQRTPRVATEPLSHYAPSPRTNTIEPKHNLADIFINWAIPAQGYDNLLPCLQHDRSPALAWTIRAQTCVRTVSRLTSKERAYGPISANVLVSYVSQLLSHHVLQRLWGKCIACGPFTRQGCCGRVSERMREGKVWSGADASYLCL